MISKQVQDKMDEIADNARCGRYGGPYEDSFIDLDLTILVEMVIDEQAPRR